MNSNISAESKGWAIGVAGTLLIASSHAAFARDGISFRDFRDQSPEIQRREARQLFQQLGQEFKTNNQRATQFIAIPQIAPLAVPVMESNSVAALNAPISRILNRSKQLNESGRMIRLDHGVNLDLTSHIKNITLGADLFQGQASVEIKIGEEIKILSAGSQVSAAEFIAARQVLAGGTQQLILDKTGRADGGTVDLSALTQDNGVMRASNLVVAKDVTTYGDFGRRSDFRLLGDLDNYGSVHATSTSNSVRSGAIRANDINNFSGASITSTANLTLDAAGDLTNAGSISSEGSLTLTAGGVVENSGSISAKSDVNFASASIKNNGAVESGANLNLNGSSGLALMVDNKGGTLSAITGAINVRGAAYSDEFNTLIVGGDLLSKELNLNSGRGTVDVAVNELTGTVNQTGTAAHVLAQTDVLKIGEVCLTGDPTYYNTRGDINIDGNITVAEALVFIAAGNITSVDNINIVAGDNSTRGFDITFIAGAGFTPTGSSDSPNPPTTANPGGVVLTGKASKYTNLLGEKLAGGNIDLGNGVTIAARAALAPAGTTDGANINMYAFEAKKGDGTGKILIEGASLFTGGSGSFGSNGDIQLLASASEGVAIRTGNMSTRSSNIFQFVDEGTISINVTKIYNPTKIPIEYNANGQRISNSDLVAFGTRAGDIIVSTGTSLNARNSLGLTGGNVQIDGALTADNFVSVFALNSIAQDATAPAIVANDNVQSKIQIRADKGSIGLQGAPLRVDTGILRIENQGPLANVSVINSGDLQINGATSGGNLIISASDRTVVADGNPISAGNSVSLTAGLFFQMQGTITAGSEVVLHTTTSDLTSTPFQGGLLTPRLVLIADTGNVGASSANRFAFQSAKTVDVSAAGGVFLNTLDAKKGVTFTGIDAGEDINIRGAGSLTFTGLTNSASNATDIEIASGTLTISGAMQAADSLRLVNPNVKGKMIFAAGLDIDTLSATDGDILISLGPTSATPFTPTDNVTVSGAGGTAFFTGNGFKTKAPTNNFVLKGADIQVNNGNKSGNMLFNGGVSITADPPVADGAPTFFHSYDKATADGGIIFDTTTQIAAPRASETYFSQLVPSATSFSAIPDAQTVNLLEANQSLAANVLTATNQQMLTATSIPGTVGSSTYISVQQPKSFEHDADVVTKETEVAEGNKLFIASEDISISTNFGKLKLAAGAVVLVSAGEAHLSVYNLHDAGGVSLISNGKRVSLLPGKHATLSKSQATSLADVNQFEAIAHRNIQRNDCQDGTSMFVSEFSIPSAVSAIKPLKALFASNNKDAKQLTTKLTKTSAVLMHLNNGNYELQVKPRMVALR